MRFPPCNNFEGFRYAGDLGLSPCLSAIPSSVNSGSSKRMNTNGTTAAGVGSWDGASSNGAAVQQFF